MIFICDFDPMGLGKYRYTVHKSLLEEESFDYQNDFQDEFVRQLQEKIVRIKRDREMGERYMLFEEMMANEYKAGKADGLEEGEASGLLKGIKLSLKAILSQKGELSTVLVSKIEELEDMDRLNKLMELALACPSIAEFEEKLDATVGQ